MVGEGLGLQSQWEGEGDTGTSGFLLALEKWSITSSSQAGNAENRRHSGHVCVCVCVCTCVYDSINIYGMSKYIHAFVHIYVKCFIPQFKSILLD
jgi:hypothetical protein